VGPEFFQTAILIDYPTNLAIAAPSNCEEKYMNKIFALLAAFLLSCSLSFAQTADRPSSNDTSAVDQRDNSPRHDYGWLGLLGLAGLAGLAGRRRAAPETHERTAPTDIRRAA